MRDLTNPFFRLATLFWLLLPTTVCAQVGGKVTGLVMHTLETKESGLRKSRVGLQGFRILGAPERRSCEVSYRPPNRHLED
jgi:hypothetical protein